mgnify:CR=1 FL=1
MQELKKSKLKLNFIYNSLYQLTAILIPLVTTPYLTRVLGAKGIGEYSYTFSIVTYFALFIKLGLDNYGNRTIAYIRGKKKNISSVFWNIYMGQLIFGITSIILYCLYCYMFSKQYYNIAMLQLIYLISVLMDITWFFAGMELFKITVTRDFLIKILTTSLIFIFVKQPKDTWKYTLIISSGFLFSQLFLWLTLFKYVSFEKPRLGEVLRHIKPNLVLFIPAIAVSIYKTMDKIMLGYISGTTEVGYYESSERLLKVPLALVSSLGIVMLPRMSKLIGENNENDFNSLFEKSILFAMFMSTSLGFGIMTVAKEFVPLFFGIGFNKCIMILYLLLPSSMFLAFGNVVQTQYLIPRKKDRIFIIALFVGAITNLIFNCMLIPKLGSIGAATGTLLAEMFVCIYETLGAKRDINIKRLFFESIPFLFSGITMFLFVKNLYIHSLAISILFKIVVGVIVYIVTLVVLSLILNFCNHSYLTINALAKQLFEKLKKK